MKNHHEILEWAAGYLISKGYTLQRPPELVLETPWSTVFHFSTTQGSFYLKQTPVPIFIEAKIIQLLSNQFHAAVPKLFAINENLCCFLMQDGGKNLRQYLKAQFQPELLSQAILQAGAMQRSTENNLDAFFALNIPDWRLAELPGLYEHLLNQTDFLKADGVTDQELKVLQGLTSKLSEQCTLLSQYHIPETFVQNDFHTNNILFDPATQKITFIDLGESVITHPFFSLHTFLQQAITHHNIKETDALYLQLQDTFFKSWLDISTKTKLSEVFKLTQKIWPIYLALGAYRLMTSVDLQAFKMYYANKPGRIAECLRRYK